MRALLSLVLLSLLACADEGSLTVDGGADAGSPGGDGGAVDGGAVDAENDDGAIDAGADATVDDAGSVSDAGRDAEAGDAGASGPTLADRLLALRDPSATEASLDALIHEVAWAEGWPLTDGTRWLFATRWDDAPSEVGLVSDVNAWVPAPAELGASGVHYFVVLDTLGVPAAGAKYKWRGGADIFRAPPEARAYGFDDFGEFGYVAPPRDARWRERFPDYVSSHLELPRAFRAYLPAGFRPGDDARVLFMHDGQNILHPDASFGGWQVDVVVSGAGLEDVVVLALDNAADRMDAYTPVSDNLGDGVVGGRADDYGRLVFEEALPFFRAQYGIGATRDDLVLAGSSLGGLVSLDFAITHESEMRCVIAMSPTLGWGAFDPALDGSGALVSRWARHGSVAIYLDSGGGGPCADTDGDGVFEDEGSDNYCTAVQLRDHLQSLGYAFDTDLFHWHEAGATHDEAAWAARMPTALQGCVSAGWVP